MLWTDRDILEQDDLVTVDAKILDVVNTAGITLEGDRGVIPRVMAECGGTLLSRLQQFSDIVTAGSISSNHVRAVLDTGSADRLAPSIDLIQIVVDDKQKNTRWSTLRLWCAYKALRWIYRAAKNRAVQDDRFTSEMIAWEEELQSSFSLLKGEGLPFVSSALSAPAAPHEFNTGTFKQADITSGGVGTWTAAQHYFAITYTGSEYKSPSDKKNSESAPTPTLNAVISLNEQVTVSIANINQPDRDKGVGTSRGISPRITPTGWNVYAGQNETDLFLQNVGPIPIATKTLVITNPVFSGDRLDPFGQYPDARIGIQDHISRG